MAILRTPIKIGELELHNRLVMPPMATGKSEENDAAGRALCAYYDEKSRGGHIGLIICEHSYVSPEGKAGSGQVSISRDRDVAGLAELTAVIHKNGSKVFAQVNHAGANASREVTGAEPISASAVRVQKSAPEGELPRDMTREDIARVTDDFAQAARRAKEAGFDGVELHSAHGYLLNQFYSPLSNRRADEYGGALSGRIRLHLEIIRAVRAQVGEKFPVALRLGACDYREGGSTIGDAVAAAKAFEAAGIDLLDISGGFSGFTVPGASGQGYFRDATRAIKAHVGIPVLLTGGITEAAAAEGLLADGDADLIGVGRAILKDSAWAEHAMKSLS